MQTIDVSSVKIGPGLPLAVIAGPCLAESPDVCLYVGETLRDKCLNLGFGYIFKASFDKANRSSIHSDRGPGLHEGIRLLEAVGEKLGVPVTTDIHLPEQAKAVGTVIDMLQVPAFLCRQTDLLVAAAETGRPVNVKKGQFLSPAEMANVVSKITEAAPSGSGGGGGGGVMLTERGTFFGYHRLVNDFAGLGDLMDLGWPVCFDVTHSTQQPGAPGMGGVSGGRPERAPLLARAAVAAGVQAIFLETHPDPSNAQSDAASMLPIEDALHLLDDLSRLHRAMGSIVVR